MHAVEVVSDDEARSIRSRFIERFIDTTTRWYERILTSTEEDGSYTTGYLWECLRDGMKVVAPSEAYAWLRDHEDVLALWDIPSRRRVWTDPVFEPYERFPKGAAVRTTGAAILEHRLLLPEDIYVFDDTGDWCVALTHETDENDADYCLLLEL
jgi:hypothetical protein